MDKIFDIVIHVFLMKDVNCDNTCHTWLYLKYLETSNNHQRHYDTIQNQSNKALKTSSPRYWILKLSLFAQYLFYEQYNGCILHTVFIDNLGNKIKNQISKSSCFQYPCDRSQEQEKFSAHLIARSMILTKTLQLHILASSDGRIFQFWHERNWILALIQ